MEDFNWSGFFWGFVITWVILKLFQGYLETKNELLKKDIEQLEKKLKTLIIKVNVEKHGEFFYLFEQETDRFIAQGKSADELKSILQQRYPDKTIFADKRHLESIGLEL